MAIENRRTAIENRRTSTTGGKTLSPSAKAARGTTLYPSEKRSGTKSSRTPSTQASNENWVESFAAPVKKVERDVETFLTKEPLATVGFALGVGLIGGFFFKKYQASQAIAAKGMDGKKSRSGRSDIEAGAALALAGFLTKGLAGMATRVESEFGAFRGGGIADVKENLTQIITNELTEKPFETIATAVGAGFGIANLEFSQVKNGAIRVAKTLAVRTLENNNANQLGNQNEGETHV